jgi:accessory gene regulator B
MINKLCDYLTNKIMENDISINDERAEIINYGLQNLIGELPKGIIIFSLAYILGLFNHVVISTIVLLIYRAFAGGVHLKTNKLCLLVSGLLVIGSSYFAESIEFNNSIVLYSSLFCINIYLVALYAPADTYNRPIISEIRRFRQKVECYITIVISYLLSIYIIKDQVISNVILYTITIESFMITPLAYKIFDNKYGIERKREIKN